MSSSRAKKYKQDMENDSNRSTDDRNARLPEVVKNSHSNRGSNGNGGKRGQRPSLTSNESTPIKKRSHDTIDASSSSAGRLVMKRIREGSSSEDSESEGPPANGEESIHSGACRTSSNRVSESDNSTKQSIGGAGSYIAHQQYATSLLGSPSLLASNLLSGFGRASALPGLQTASLSQNLLFNQARQQLLDQQIQAHVIQQSLGGLNLIPSMPLNPLGPYVPGYVFSTPYHQPLMMMMPHGQSSFTMPFGGLPLREQAILLQQNQPLVLAPVSPIDAMSSTLQQPREQLGQLSQQQLGQLGQLGQLSQHSRKKKMSQSPMELSNRTTNSQDLKDKETKSNKNKAEAILGLLGPASTRSTKQGKTRMLMYIQTDEGVLSEYQILLRQNIEFFQASRKDVETTTPGRKKPIVLGQVGIRCIHCGPSPAHHRTSAAVYFPSRLGRLYQSAQNIGLTHFGQSCTRIDPKVRAKVKSFHDDGKKATAGHGGKDYWSNAARAQGVIETDTGLRFEHDEIGRLGGCANPR